MSQRPPLQIRYNPARTADTWQRNYPGAQAEPYRRGWRPEVEYTDADVVAICRLRKWLFLAGEFTTIGGAPSELLAAVNLETGVRSASFTVPVFFDTNTATVNALASDTQYLYVGGKFDTINGETTLAGRAVNGICRIDYKGNVDTTWNPGLNQISTDPVTVTALAWCRSRQSLYIGSADLDDIAGETRLGGGEVDIVASNGTPTGFAPALDGATISITVDEEEGFVYYAGAFANAQSTARPCFARFDMTTGVLDSWNPAVQSAGTPEGWSVLIADGSIYIGGTFETVLSTTRNNAAAVDTLCRLLPWNPNASTTVTGLAKIRDTLFLAGKFTTIGGTARNRLAAVTDVGAGTLDEWDPDANDDVLALYRLDDMLYVGGSWSTLDVSSNEYVAAVPYPIFTDTNTKHVAKTGADTDAGTAAAPKLTIAAALAGLTAGFRYALVTDSGVYDESLTVSYSGALAGGLYAADGEDPTITRTRGAVAGTYGARREGRTMFSSGAAGTFYYVSKTGNDSTGTRGDRTKPFLTAQAAFDNGSRVAGDTVQWEDDALYVEDLDIKYKSVTLQAAEGKVPILRGALPASKPIIGCTGSVVSVTLNLYGLTISQAVGTSFASSIALYMPWCAVNIYDCSFIDAGTAVAMPAAGPGTQATALVIRNTLFYRQVIQAIRFSNNPMAGSTGLNCDNCAFVNIGRERSASIGLAYDVTLDVGDVDLRTISSNGGHGLALTRCTFLNSRNRFNVFHYTPSVGGNEAALSISSCEFRNDRVRSANTIGVFSNQTSLGSTIELSLFEGLGDAAVLLASNASTTGTATAKNVRYCVARNCGRNLGAVAAAGIFAVNLTTTNLSASNVAFANDVVLTCPVASFYYSETTSANARTLSYNNCVSINPSREDIKLATSANLAVTYAGNILAGRATGYQSIAKTGAATTAAGSVNNYGNRADGAGGIVFVNDPLVYSEVTLTEDSRLQANSPCINALEDRGNIGRNYSLLTVSPTGPFVVDGFILTGDTEFHNGLLCSTSGLVRLWVESCTFSGLGVEALRPSSGTTVEDCLFTLTGIGVNISQPEVTVRHCVGQNCASAFLVVGPSSLTIEHVTGFGASYGQFDLGSAGAIMCRDNVYSGNAYLDYSGTGTQTFSDVVNISETAVVEGSRRDPLFRDATTPDLRLQTTPSGHYYDSPARALAHDGTDAGAYDCEYGELETAWTVLDFAEGAGDPLLAWRNPRTLERRIVPLKLTEGDTHGGTFYSSAAIYRREYALKWGAADIMPDAQREALAVMYQSGDGEVGFSLDAGATWINGQLVRSKDFKYKELGGLPYSNDSIPMPITELVIRESTA